MFEEKHLIAVNDEVREKLAMERRSINRLLRQIHQETVRLRIDATGPLKVHTCGEYWHEPAARRRRR